MRPSNTLPAHGLLLLVTFLGRSLAQTQCYGLDGEQLDSSFVPCNPDDAHSPCCASNKDGGDVCLSSGLCYVQGSGLRGLIYQNGCTDSSGLASECPEICPDRRNDWNDGELDPIGSWNIHQCEPNVFCCRPHLSAEDCCGDESLVVTRDVGLLQTATAKTRTVTVVLSGTQTSTTTPTTTTTSTATTTPSESGDAGEAQESLEECEDDNMVAIVGGAVGGILGALLLASLGVVFILWRRLKAERASHGVAQYVNSAPKGYPPTYNTYQAHEAGGKTATYYEMQT